MPNYIILQKIVPSLLLLVCALGFSQVIEYNIKNLDLNTEYPHFGVSLSGTNSILFTSYALKKNGKPKKTFEGEGVLTIYKGSITDDGNIKNIKPLTIDPESNIESITSATLSSGGKYLYVTTTYTNKNRPKGSFNKANFHIAVGEYKTGVGFTNFKVLPFCKARYSYAHPTLSYDGKTLFFTANIKGGRETTKGGSDIFKVEILGDTMYGKIKNLGSKVNSYSREMFPTLAADNTLYFSSNKSNGIGGYDLYKSTMNNDGTFNKAERLLKPLNSAEDDLSVVMLPNGNSGFIVSKRKDGEGADDIYYFSLKKQ